MLEFKDKQKTLFERLKKLKENATKSEIEFKNILDKNNIKYIFQKGFIKGDYYCIVDFYIPKKKICIEIDGEYHYTSEQIKKDSYRDNYLINRGFKVIRIKNNEVNSYNLETICL